MQQNALWIDERYTSKSDVKILHELADPAEPVLEFWNDPDAEEFSCAAGESLRTRIRHSRELLKQRGIRRQPIVHPYFIALSSKGKPFRKWDDGGREWQAGELTASVLESCYSTADNSLLCSYYYSSVFLTP